MSLKLFHRKNSKVVQHYDDIGLANLLIERKEYEEVEKLLNKILKGQQNENSLHKVVDIRLTFFKLALAREILEEYSYEDVWEMLRTFERSLYTYYWKSKIRLVFNEARLFIYDSNFMDVSYQNQAQQVLDKVLLKHKVPVENRCFIPINILNVLCYLELGNVNIAQRELTNFKRKLQRNDLFSPILKNLLQQLMIIIQSSFSLPKIEALKPIIQTFEENQERKFFNFWAKEKLKEMKKG